MDEYRFYLLLIRYFRVIRVLFYLFDLEFRKAKEQLLVPQSLEENGGFYIGIIAFDKHHFPITKTLVFHIHTNLDASCIITDE